VVCKPFGIGVDVVGQDNLHAFIFLVEGESVRILFLRDLLAHATYATVKMAPHALRTSRHLQIQPTR
jgi:hypothetical protein